MELTRSDIKILRILRKNYCVLSFSRDFEGKAFFYDYGFYYLLLFRLL
jgi:hypothetical protein